MTDHANLKRVAEASLQAWDQHSKADSHKFYEAWCKAEEEFSMAAREEVVLALIAENEQQAKTIAAIDKQLRGHVNDPDPLPSIMPGALQIETTYGLVAGIRRERDQLKAERDSLREDRDGLLEAGAHLL